GADGVGEGYACRVALHERALRVRSTLGPLLRNRDSLGGAVHADDLAGLAHELCREEGDVPASRPDIEHAHAACQTCLDQKLPRDRPDQLRLEGETLELHLRMA